MARKNLYKQHLASFVSARQGRIEAEAAGRKASYLETIYCALAYHATGAWDDKTKAEKLRKDIAEAFPGIKQPTLNKLCDDARGTLGILPQGTPITFEGIDGVLQSLATEKRAVRSASDIRGIVSATKANGGTLTLPTRKGNGKGKGKTEGAKHKAVDPSDLAREWVNLFGELPIPVRKQALDMLAKAYSHDVALLADRILGVPKADEAETEE